MDPFDEDKDRRKRKYPSDFLNDKELEQIFKEMKKMFESNSFQEMIEKKFCDNLGSNKHFIHGLNINILPIVRPKPKRYNNRPLKNSQRKTASSEENEQLPDIIKGDKEVAVTVEIPSVEKEEINLNATENTLEIIVNNPKRKYHKLLNLPCSIKPKTLKSTYKNGVLDIVVKRWKRRKTGAGYRPTI
jgi:HSP20 family protein